MLTSEEMNDLIAAGADAKQLAIFTSILEKRTARLEQIKAQARDRKRKQRQSHVTVTGQSQMCHVTSPSQGSDGFPHPSLTPNSPPKENPLKGSKEKSPFVLPEWLSAEAWQGFEEMRKQIRKPLTVRARRLAVGKLEEFRSKGHDPTEILNQSTMNCYQGLFETKEKFHAKPSSYHSKSESTRSKTTESLAALHAAGSRVIQRQQMEPGAGENEVIGAGTAAAAGALPP